MQLARDAHSSGDRVMAESYYQHADHYYRVWLAAQPVGQPVHFPRRLDEDVRIWKAVKARTKVIPKLRRANSKMLAKQLAEP
jgi:hypothetical protein